jgi:chromosome segregation ATPase
VREAEAAAAAVANDWGSRATEIFEADIENYRARIKTLLKEKDALLKERDQFAGTAQDTSTLDDLKNANEKLTAQVQSLSLERDKLAAAAQDNSALHSLKSANEKLTADLESARLERDHFVAQVATFSTGQEKLSGDLQYARAELDRAAQQLSEAAAEREKLSAELAGGSRRTGGSEHCPPASLRRIWPLAASAHDSCSRVDKESGQFDPRARCRAQTRRIAPGGN